MSNLQLDNGIDSYAAMMHDEKDKSIDAIATS
jgi:hypothetical protein